ncbi:hypothetical protein F5050DRAFT_1828277 [Lentinula boryana]|uniref:Uncharacterized protein n=1 Tax=Lentinula boryana TaxID=40481 RepID=A0ABQ8QA14_9AGAR|nr:hypothetical protein F5050DRAFT_1828277 [Lentinula boryana]
MGDFDLKRWCQSITQGQGEIEYIITQALERVRTLERSVDTHHRIAKSFVTMMDDRLTAMNGVLLGCQECMEGKAKITASISGRTVYGLLQPLIHHLEQQASELTESVREVKRLATTVEQRHSTLIRVYMIQKDQDQARIKSAESRLKGKLLDIRKAKIAMAYHKLDGLETKLKAFESDWKLRQKQFEEFEVLVDKVQKCSRESMWMQKINPHIPINDCPDPQTTLLPSPHIPSSIASQLRNAPNYA